MSEAKERLQAVFQVMAWEEVIRLATLILESHPNEPMALAALAEAEYARGNLQTAISCLSHAVDTAPQNIPFYHRLIHWHRQAGNEQAAQAISQMMQQQR
jgi:Flp pilus assembly protein TadD